MVVHSGEWIVYVAARPHPARVRHPRNRCTCAGSPSILEAMRTASQNLHPKVGMPRDLRLTGTLSESQGPMDVLDLLALDAFTSGREPHARSSRLDDVLPEATLLPRDAEVIREAVDDDRRAWLA